MRPISDSDQPVLGISLRATIVADLRAMAELKGVRFPSLTGFVDLLTLPGVWATIVFRVADRAHRIGLRPISRLLAFANFVLFSTELYPGADIGPGFVMPHPGGVGIAKGTVLGRDFHALGGVRIGGAVNEDRSADGYPTFGDDCWMLDGAKAFGGITVGDGTWVAASSVVLTDLPANVVAAGIPARVLKERAPES